MRRITLPLVVALALVAAACSTTESTGDGGGESASATCPTDALDSATTPVELTMWETFTAEPLQAMEALVEEYNASQDKVVVTMQNQGVAYEEIQRKFNQAISTPDELPGLVVVEDTQTQFMADSGVVTPAQACFEASDTSLDSFIPVVREYYTANDELQAGMSQLSNAVLYLNANHFRDAGLDPTNPPQTLDEIQEAARAIKAAGISEKPFVLVLQPWFIEHWLTGAGATVVNNDNGRSTLATESTFDNATTLEIYTWLQEMNDEGLLNAVPGTEGQVDHYFAIGLQQSSFTVETSTAISTIDSFLAGTLDPAELGLEGVDSLPAQEGLDIAVAPYPGVEAAGQVQAGGGAWYITNTTPPEVQAAAWDFISWFNSRDTQVTWSETSAYLPWNEEATQSEQLQTYWADTRRGSWTEVSYQQLADMNSDSPGPLIGPYTETRTAIRTSLERLILEGVSPQDAISQADAEIDAALQAYEDTNF
jgi:sn-glycerol 3-phosphate transport system substrate-binding protein